VTCPHCSGPLDGSEGHGYCRELAAVQRRQRWLLLALFAVMAGVGGWLVAVGLGRGL
jgi:hypothetical protein